MSSRFLVTTEVVGETGFEPATYVPNVALYQTELHPEGSRLF